MTQNEPGFPFGVSLIRALGFFAGIIGCFVEILKVKKVIDNTLDFIMLFMIIFVASFGLLYLSWKYHRKFNKFDDDTLFLASKRKEIFSIEKKVFATKQQAKEKNETVMFVSEDQGDTDKIQVPKIVSLTVGDRVKLKTSIRDPNNNNILLVSTGAIGVIQLFTQIKNKHNSNQYFPIVQFPSATCIVPFFTFDKKIKNKVFGTRRQISIIPFVAETYHGIIGTSISTNVVGYLTDMWKHAGIFQVLIGDLTFLYIGYKVSLLSLTFLIGFIFSFKHVDLIYKQVLVFAIFNVILMFLQVSNAGDWTQFLSTESTALFGEKITYDTLFVTYDNLNYSVIQARPSGFLRSNNILSGFVIFGFALHFSRDNKRFWWGTLVLCTMMVLAGARIIYLCYIIMIVIIILGKNKFFIKKAINSILCVITLSFIYYLLFLLQLFYYYY